MIFLPKHQANWIISNTGQKTVVLNTESTELARVRRILLMEERIPSIVEHGQMDIDLLYAELGLRLKHMREIGFYLEKKFEGLMTDHDVQERLHFKAKLLGPYSQIAIKICHGYDETTSRES